MTETIAAFRLMSSTYTIETQNTQLLYVPRMPRGVCKWYSTLSTKDIVKCYEQTFVHVWVKRTQRVDQELISFQKTCTSFAPWHTPD